jgi:hypothetical protein
MTKYGFDYFTKRAELLTEMARTTTRYNGLNVGGEYDYDFVALRAKVLNAIKSGMSPHNASDPLVDEDGKTATGVVDGSQYRSLIYMFSKVYNTILDNEEFDIDADVEFENAKGLLSSDISKLPVSEDVHAIIYEIQNQIKENGIKLDKPTLDNVTREIISKYVPNIAEILKAHDSGDKNSGIEELPVIPVDIYRDPSRFLSSLFEIRNSKTTSGRKVVDDPNKKPGKQPTLIEEYTKKMQSLARKIYKQYVENPKKAPSGPEIFEAATIVLIKKHPELIFDKSFVNSVLDPVNIATFINKGESGEGIVVLDHETSKLAARNIGEMYGINAKSYNELMSKSRKVRTQLSYLSRADAKRKVKTSPTVEKKSSPDKLDNLHTQNVDNILTILLALKEDKIDLDEQIEIKSELFKDPYDVILTIHDETDVPIKWITSMMKLKGTQVIDRLYDVFLTLENVGIDIDTFNENMEELKSKKPELVGFIDIFTKDVSLKIKADTPKSNVLSFPGFAQEHIEKVLDTPEKKNIFSTYYNYIYVKDLKRAAAEVQQKLDVDAGKEVVGKPVTLYAMRQAEKNFQKSSGKFGNRGENMEREAELAKREKDKEFKKDQNKLSKGIQDIIGKPLRNESYVMNYMTEQFQKDRFKTKGEFKDRGYKKPTNYWQGRNL